MSMSLQIHNEDLGPIPTLKPILYTTYDAIIKYNLTLYYEDNTSKNIELVIGNKDRPYHITYKKEGKLLTVVGIPYVYEISENSRFCDFPNKVMDAKDLLFEMDCSSQYECKKVKFYLKDIRNIIDIVTEGLEEDPNDPMENLPITLYPIYLNNHSCEHPVKCIVDDDLTVTLESKITKLGDPLTPDQYSNFSVILIEGAAAINGDVEPKDNIIPLKFAEEALDKEIYITIRYFIKEINHYVYDDFIIIPSLKSEDNEEDNNVSTRAVSTQDMQYLGDGLEPALGSGLTPGYKPYQYRKNK